MSQKSVKIIFKERVYIKIQKIMKPFIYILKEVSKKLKIQLLNNNALQTIEGLDELKNLVSLFLNHNLIDKYIKFRIVSQSNTLNLQHNSIKKIENLNTLIHLQNLNLSYNQLTDYDQLIGILEFPSIFNLELSIILYHMKKILYKYFKKTNVACLYLKDNNIVRECPNYRRTLISSIKTFQLLDYKPVINFMQRNILDEGENMEEQLELKEAELKRIETELDNYKMLELTFYQYFMATKDNFGNRIISNKTEEEERIIKKRCFNNELQDFKNEQRLQKCQINEKQINEINNGIEEKINDVEQVNLNYDKFVINLNSPDYIIEDPKQKQAKELQQRREDGPMIMMIFQKIYQFVINLILILQVRNSKNIYLEPEYLRYIWTCLEFKKKKKQSLVKP